MGFALLIIDPQNDFASKEGSLYVPGAEEDCVRLASFIRKNINDISSIYITLDNHPTFHIAHPCFWADRNGKSPEPYTTIKYSSFMNKDYQPVKPEYIPVVEEYLMALENKNRYNLTIWPPHCINGTWGSCVVPELWQAVNDWELSSNKNADFIRKSVNPLTEHYSAIQAEVPDPSDSSTRTNFNFIDSMKNEDRIVIAGEALSHCVANTLRDVAVYIPAYKMTVLLDCTSNVKGFESVGNDFINEYRAKGMIFSTSDTFTV